MWEETSGIMIRKAFKMKLYKGMADEYKRRHRDIWPEMVELLKKHGGHNYSIFLDSETNVLFSYIEIENEELWAEKAKTEICKKWWSYMADLMETNEDKSPIGKGLYEVFYLE